MLWQLFQAYPGIFVFTVLGPIIAGVGAAMFGAWGGYENLKHQFATDQQSQRIEDKVTSLGINNDALISTLHLLEARDEKLKSSGKRDTVLVALINQYQQLSKAVALFGEYSHRDTSEEQGKVAAKILDILNQDIVRTFARNDLPGKPLIIELAPNSFRVIFNVPMPIPPKLTFLGLPAGVSPVVTDASEISFTVNFLPLSIPIQTFGYTADAEL
jgi:hypothetical protein